MTKSSIRKGFFARFNATEAVASPTPDAEQQKLQQIEEVSKPQKVKSRKRRSIWFQLLRYSFWLTFGISVGGVGAAVWIWNSLEEELPGDVRVALTFVRDGTLTIKASDGRILQQLGPATREKLPLAKIPADLVNAFIAIEDHRFYDHEGVDYQGVLRAIFSNLAARDVVEGGSTLTQQLARIVFLNQEQSIWRKLKEAMLAYRIEQQMTKYQVLERYLNLVYLGSGAYGIADAAWVYFSKPVYKLTLAEIATIAGLPPAPSIYSPLVNPNLALTRRNLVLQRMQEEGFITLNQAQSAKQEPLNLQPSPPKRLKVEYPYFTTYIQQELPRYVSPEAVEIGGLTVEASLNVQWQKLGEQVIRETIELDGPGQGFSQAALVAIDPRTGEIKAMVGGLNYGESQFNRVTQAQRQPGSTFKVLVYAAAIATGMSPYDGYQDAPYSIDGYQPLNASRKHYGWLSLKDALTYSVNVVAVKVLVDVGFDPIIKLSKNMGIKSKLKPVYSLALGASEVNLLELTSSYGTLAAKGYHAEATGIRRILNRNGEVLYDFRKTKPKRVLDPGSAAIMTWMLESVVQYGTGGNAYLEGRPVAGKTGTSEEARDLWFIGYIPQLVTGVWLGNDNNDPTWGASSTSALVWNRFMVQVTKGMPVQKFPPLPKLEGRKGSIKAKPEKGRVSRPYTGGYTGNEETRSTESEYYSAPRSSQESERRSTSDSESKTPPSPEIELKHSSPPESLEEDFAIPDQTPTPIESPTIEPPPAQDSPSGEPVVEPPPVVVPVQEVEPPPITPIIPEPSGQTQPSP